MQKGITSTFMVLGMALLLTPGAYAKLTSADVLNDLHSSNQKEAQMGQLAQDKGASDAVKSYGKMLQSDHQDNDKQLLSVAQKANIQLKADQPGMMDNMKIKSLRSKSGANFDKEFAKAMIDDHKKDIAKLQDAQNQTDLNPDVKTLVNNTLPTLKKHLEEAQKIYGQAS